MELEQSRYGWKILAIVAGVLFFFQLGLSIYLSQTYGYPIDLSKQLQSCQEKVPLWTFDYKCLVLSHGLEDSIYFVTKTDYYHLEFKNYDLYKVTKERFNERNLENCEVIK